MATAFLVVCLLAGLLVPKELGRPVAAQDGREEVAAGPEGAHA